MTWWTYLIQRCTIHITRWWSAGVHAGLTGNLKEGIERLKYAARALVGWAATVALRLRSFSGFRKVGSYNRVRLRIGIKSNLWNEILLTLWHPYIGNSFKSVGIEYSVKSFTCTWYELNLKRSQCRKVKYFTTMLPTNVKLLFSPISMAIMPLKENSEL